MSGVAMRRISLEVGEDQSGALLIDKPRKIGTFL
jgi:hypothetical protein